MEIHSVLKCAALPIIFCTLSKTYCIDSYCNLWCGDCYSRLHRKYDFLTEIKLFAFSQFPSGTKTIFAGEDQGKILHASVRKQLKAEGLLSWNSPRNRIMLQLKSQITTYTQTSMRIDHPLCRIINPHQYKVFH